MSASTITTLRILLKVSLDGHLTDKYVKHSTSIDQLVYDVYTWLHQHKSQYHVYLMWNAIRVLFATGMKEVNEEDIEKILDAESSDYFVNDRSTEIKNIKLLANMLQKKWKNIHIDAQIIPFDLNICDGVPSIDDLSFYRIEPEEPSAYKRACRLYRM